MHNSDINTLTFAVSCPVVPQNAGLFVSRGQGMHPQRVIDSHELIVVRSGTLHIREEERDFAVQTGESLLLFPHRMHIGTRDYAPDLSFYWLHFEIKKSKSVTSASRLVFSLPQHTRLTRPDFAYEHFQRFLHEQETGRLTPHSRTLLTLLLLEEVMSEQPHSDHITDNHIVKRIDALIQQRFMEPLSTRDLARAAECSPDYLGRVYKAACGQTLTEALNAARIKEACRLLRDTFLDIHEIALASGFATHTYFCRVFKDIQGMSPLAYRRKYARVHIISV